ncbi:MAG TPA: antibiotic biosynthesis monooxygenase [Nitrososphaera sp.]|jgi:heme-degrading monooxygenase HmoA|nr:antibiotic biosynthesis monooxygenase [Nitrososphaera sp.]
MVFVAISQIKIKPEMADKLEEAFRNRRHHVDTFDGFLGLQFLRGESKKDYFVGIFRFKDKESFLQYMKSDAHKVSHNSNEKNISQAIISNTLEFFTEATN